MSFQVLLDFILYYPQTAWEVVRKALSCKGEWGAFEGPQLFDLKLPDDFLLFLFCLTILPSPLALLILVSSSNLFSLHKSYNSLAIFIPFAADIGDTTFLDWTYQNPTAKKPPAYPVFLCIHEIIGHCLSENVYVLSERPSTSVPSTCFACKKPQVDSWHSQVGLGGNNVCLNPQKGSARQPQQYWTFCDQKKSVLL